MVIANDIPELDSRELRQFGLTLAAVLAVVFGIMIPWLSGHSHPWWPWVLGGGLVAWSLLGASSLRPLYRAWMRVALVINAIITRLILGIVYYLIVLPIGLVFRIRGRDPLARRWDAGATTYRVVRSKPRQNHMNNPF